MDIEDGLFTAVVIFFVLLFGGLIAYQAGYAFTAGEETITIDEKWEKRNGENEKYLVSTTNGQVFQITDSVTQWRFDSSNLYARIKPGQTCDIIYQGWRLPVFSTYKNIIEADCR